MLMTAQPLSYIMMHRWNGNYKYHDFPYGMTKYYKIDPSSRRDWKLHHD